VCGRIAVGDELVSIDGFEITPANMHLFAKRAAAGVKDSLIVLRINHPVTCDAAHASKMHDVVLQRSEIFETPPVLYTDATNASISSTVAVLTPQAGLGVVITVSTCTYTYIHTHTRTHTHTHTHTHTCMHANPRTHTHTHRSPPPR
jgi:hypothetical protein